MQAGSVVAAVKDAMLTVIEPGMTAEKLDQPTDLRSQLVKSIHSQY